MKKKQLAAMALAAVMLLLGGCGNAGANLGGTMDDYNNGRYANGGAAYWDGYGINSGRSMDGYNGGNYTTYGTRNDSTGTTLGQDLEDTWDDLTGQDRKTKDKDSKAGSKTENKHQQSGRLRKESVAENLRLRFFLFGNGKRKRHT